jgi:hypothetical protein
MKQGWFFGFFCRISLYIPLMKATASQRVLRLAPVPTSYAAFQRRILGVSYPAYNPSSNPWGQAGVWDGLTNEFVDMFTYQVFIQTLQLSERMRTNPQSLKEVWRLNQLMFRRGSVERRSALTPLLADRCEFASWRTVHYFYNRVTLELFWVSKTREQGFHSTPTYDYLYFKKSKNGLDIPFLTSCFSIRTTGFCTWSRSTTLLTVGIKPKERKQLSRLP